MATAKKAAKSAQVVAQKAKIEMDETPEERAKRLAKEEADEKKSSKANKAGTSREHPPQRQVIESDFGGSVRFKGMAAHRRSAHGMGWRRHGSIR